MSIVTLLPVAAVAYLLAQLDTTLLKTVAGATLRMILQTAVLALLLWALWYVNSYWLTAVWLAGAALAAAGVTLRRARLPQQLLLLPTWGATLLATMTGLGCFLVALQPDEPLAPRWVVGVAAVLLANNTALNARGLSAYYETLRVDSANYYTMLGNGAARPKALTPYVRQAVRSMMEPSAKTLTTTALIAMPMLMAGMLMGGMAPLQAAAVFVIMTVMAVFTALLALLLTIWMADKRTFNRRGEMMEILKNDKNKTED